MLPQDSANPLSRFVIHALEINSVLWYLVLLWIR